MLRPNQKLAKTGSGIFGKLAKSFVEIAELVFTFDTDATTKSSEPAMTA